MEVGFTNHRLTRTVDTPSIPDWDKQGRCRWQRQTPAMKAGFIDHRLTHTVDTLAIPDWNEQGRCHWQRQVPEIEVDFTDHRWTIKELLSTVVAPEPFNM